MAKVSVQVECSKECVELGQGLAKFVGAVKAAVADGWNPLTDVPAVVVAAVRDLVPAVAGAEKLPEEWAEDKVAFANAVMVTGAAVVGAVTK